ncbi:WRKY transcription factor [Salix suchowensis]|nr:WRKY transcription factor [Salix suchowensis]
MDGNGKEHQQPKQQQPPSPSKPLPSRPTTITLPPRSFTETFFSSGPGTMGFSPGPMTLLSSFFSDSDDCKSFSQLLAGAISSPNSKPPDDFSRPSNLTIAPPAPMFAMPLGLSPVSLPDSPGFGLFSPQGFGMTHQQALAQVTAQAAQANSIMHVQPEYSTPEISSTFTNNSAAHQQQQMRGKDTGGLNGNPNSQGSSELASRFQSGSGNVSEVRERKDQESSQATPEHFLAVDTDQGIYRMYL